MKMGKVIFLFVCVLFLVIAHFTIKSVAGVNVNIGINIPFPAYQFESPPSLVVIPGTHSYFVPGINVDLLFYHGYWYRPYDGRWYRANGYNGPWAYLAPARVPRALVSLPPDYRRIPPGHQQIPYGQLKKNWRQWEADRYWERDERRQVAKHEGREDRREERHKGHKEKGNHD